MATGDVSWPQYQSTMGAAILALDTSDFLTARLRVTQAKLIALGLGDAVSAGGTSVQLLVGECDKTLDMITELEKRAAMKTAQGRFIKTGLANDGHGRGWDGGVLHP